MNTISARKLYRLSGFAPAVLVAFLAPAAFAADPLPVYGGPTYSPSAGGYVANHPSIGASTRLYVNDAGTAAATVFKYGSSGTQIGQRAVRWSASSAAVELGGNPTSLFAQGINNAGTVIGQTTAQTGLPFPFNQYNSPARWAASGTAVTVLQHPNSSPPFLGVPILGDINDAGTAVGLVSLTSNLGSRPGRWDASGAALTQLGDLGTDVSGFTQAEAKAINPAGIAVGNAQKYDATGNYLGYWAVRWDASGTAATPLGHLGELENNPAQAPDGFTESQAFAINHGGTVVGYSDVYDESGVLLRTHVPVRWDAAGTPTELATGPTPDATVAWSPAALNDAGTAVGWANSLGAVRWDASGTAVTELGNITPNTSQRSEAWAINAAGTAVGWDEKYSPAGQDLGERAVYWGADTLAVDLNTLIDPNSGWLLSRASGISDTGWIAGLGMFDPDGVGGQAAYPRHFLMQVPAAVPEPGALTLLALATACGLGKRSRRRAP